MPACYDFVGLDFFSFWLDFRHPAVFFLTPHPFDFLARDFFQLCFLAPGGDEAAAEVPLEPAKNSRAVMSAIMVSNVFGMAIPCHEPGRVSSIFEALPTTA